MASEEHSANTVHQILNAKSLFGCLGLHDRVVEISIAKRQYRQLALAVHPDKCSHDLAKDAFQRLSEAFEILSTEAGQQRYLKEVLGHQQRRPTARRRDAQSSTNRWWNTRTWEEFEHRFRHREATEAALQKSYTINMKAKFAAKKVRSQILKAERSTEHCDRTAGFPENDLWPPELRGQAEPSAQPQSDSAQDNGDRPEIDHPQAAVARLLDLLTHLRTVHRYCLYCGCVFDSFEDLERNCPGFTEDEHENAPTTAARTSQETALDVAGQIEVFEEDSLDAFMAGVQEEVHKDLKRSHHSTKTRFQTAKGWSFEQQAQQNKNERKRMKRG